jgi:hypothetical protein
MADPTVFPSQMSETDRNLTVKLMNQLLLYLESSPTQLALAHNPYLQDM